MDEKWAAKLASLESENTDLSEWKNKKHTFDGEKQQLQTALDIEKKLRKTNENALERDKIQTTEKLRKEMLYKIKETKANLLALNDEQL